MRLSKRGEYGLRAMVDLAHWGTDGRTILIKEIAERENIPLKFLEQILLTLKNTGYLRSKMGTGGGYYLARSPQEITFGQIIRTLDGPLAPIKCVSQTAYEPCDCPDDQTCGLRMVMLNVRNAIAGILDNTTLADVAQQVKAAQALKDSQLGRLLELDDSDPIDSE
jgi:Rrf2 family protein